MKAFMHTFNTHKHIKVLQAIGFDKRQAEVIVKSLFESRDYGISKLSTKEQFFILEKDLKSIEKDLKLIEKEVKLMHIETKEESQAVDKEMKNFSTKDELNLLRKEMKEGFQDISEEMKNFVTKDEFYSYVKLETTAVKNDILKWMVPLLLAIILQLFLK